MDLKIKFNNARKKLQLSFKAPISFKTTEVHSRIKLLILAHFSIL